MTAVATPPSFQSLPRWSSDDEKQGLDSMSAEEVTRMFMPRKSAQRTNSSSSMSSVSSASSNTPASSAPSPIPHNNADTPTTNGEQGGWGAKKKAPRGLWPSSKAEPVSGISTARSQALPTPSSGQSAASTMNTAMHQPSPILPSQNRLPSQSLPNASRSEQGNNAAESLAMLALLPMTGTFERKQIVVPLYPEVLRIGRQTNAKTVPTAANGFFDSKVLSRQHAEVWAEKNGKIWIRDVKSSNGTFVNGVRLSPENRDSEPHELREQDTLELGIDIVSEDQKSIVHHKVSAKVELAGIYPSPPSLFEMDFNPNSPNAVGLLDQTNQMAQMRARGNQGPVNGRLNGMATAAGNNANMVGPHRQMNLWMGPITMEQVVKKLTTELRSAKQQSQDLHRTGEFFNTLLALKPGEEPPKSPHKASIGEKPSNIAPLPALVDPISPFSQPPAPPPQQPLPEKPDAARYTLPSPTNQPNLKRADTERPLSNHGSPTRVESSQILSLVEALKFKERDLDTKVDYIKQLEVELAREKQRREAAEKRLSGDFLLNHDHSKNGNLEEESFEPPLDEIEMMGKDIRNGHVDNDDDVNISRSSSMATIREVEENVKPVEDAPTLASRLQAQLDLRNQEIIEMKLVMESYRQKAEDAEEGRRSLAQMVEDIRAGRSAQGDSTSIIDKRSTQLEPESSKSSNSLSKSQSSNQKSSLQQQLQHRQPNGTAAIGNISREIEKTVSNVLQQQQREWADPGESGRMVQSAPYVSMVGVVLIGVGIMTWLNGWQPGGDK